MKHVYNLRYKKCVIKKYEEFKFNDTEITCMYACTGHNYSVTFSEI